MNIKQRIIVSIFAGMIVLICNQKNLLASGFHYSIIGGTYLSDTSKIVYDASIFLNQQWGIRYTVIPGFKYQNEDAITTTGSTVSNYSIEGEYKAPSMVYLLDYQTINNSEPGPFDFIAAYISFGYAEQDVTVYEHRYTATGNQIRESYHQKDTKTPVYSTAIGFYGGQKFIVADASLRYLRGYLNDTSAISEKITFAHWLITFSIGFGF